MSGNGYQVVSQFELEEVQEPQTPLANARVPAWLKSDSQVPKWWLWLAGAANILVLLVLVVLVFVLGTRKPQPIKEVAAANPVADSQPAQPQYMSPSGSLNFDHPTRLVRENLKNDTFYITSFAQAGFTNEFIAYIQLIYLGLLTTRVPIIPPIIPAAHVSKTAGLLPFSSIFNLTNLRSALRSPILEWADVKTLSPNVSVTQGFSDTDPDVEQLGCWSTKPRTDLHPNNVPPSENVLKLDLSFTRVPGLAYYHSQDQKSPEVTFYGLAATVLPGEHKHRDADATKLSLMQKSRLGSELKPEDQLACFDFLYYITSGTVDFEFEEKWSPVWFVVGRHLTFTEHVTDLAEGYVRRALGIAEDDEIPVMVTVHIRRGDFGQVCKAGDTPPCQLPLSAYKDAVDKMKDEVFRKHGVDVTHVLVASDETDPEFYDEMRSYGWSYLNHTEERTLEKYGEWYPLIIDKATLSMGLGFVGTAKSTFSILNARRVEDWNNGITQLLDYWA